MHKQLLKNIVSICRQRLDEGDCPTVPRLSSESLEDAVIDLAADNKRLRQILAKKCPTGNPCLLCNGTGTADIGDGDVNCGRCGGLAYLPPNQIN